MKDKQSSFRVFAPFPVALISLLLVGLLQWSGLMQRAEYIAEDWRMQWVRAGSELDPRIAVVLIDDASLQALESELGRFPWPRGVYADLIDFMALGGARAVVYDILFPEREASGDAELSPDDQRLARATALGARAVHAVQFIRDADDSGAWLAPAPLPADFARRFGREWAGVPGEAPAYNRFLIPYAGLYQAASGVGAVGLEPDDDGVYRRARLFWPYQGKAYPLLGAAPVIGATADDVRLREREIEIGLQIIPADAQGHFAFAMVDEIPAYSIGGILESQRQIRAGMATPLVDPREFESRIVFVGAGAAGLQDVKATALGAKTPGVFIHASIASNLLQKEFFVPVAPAMAWSLVITLALLTAMVVIWPHNFWIQMLTPMGLVVAYLGISLLWFRGGTVAPVAAPTVAIATSWLFAAAFLAFTEGRDKKRVRTMLGQYVSPDVLQTVMQKYRDRVTAEVGSSEELTVLFSDIRGFTSLSENLPAEQVVELLNIHFSEMTEIVFSHHGTLDKFIGDAMMVFWGAPVPAADHADRAMRAALAMYAGLERVNRRLGEKSYPTIDIGIGVNTGAMVLGNVGSERKLDYTVVGDNVNLASRLEGLSKFYGCPIVVSETTLSSLSSPPDCIPLDLVRVKGRVRPIRIFAPVSVLPGIGESAGAQRRLQEQVETAFQAYLCRDFDRAHSIYSQLPLTRLREIFVDRCVRFSGVPPAEDWDGVYTQISK